MPVALPGLVAGLLDAHQHYGRYVNVVVLIQFCVISHKVFQFIFEAGIRIASQNDSSYF